MIRISASEKGASWHTALPPLTKRRIRLALRRLVKGKGDIKGLHAPLEGVCRLRVGGIRIIYRQVSDPEIHLDYAQTRDVFYEIFERLLQQRKKP